mgnify:CR=1 FL=1
MNIAAARDILLDHLIALYGGQTGRSAFERLQQLLARYQGALPLPVHPPGLSERDALLITYGDQVRQPGVPPLQSVAELCEQRLVGLISTIHLLPFYPYSSDDGFSVIDYWAVDPALGSWDDVRRLGRGFRLMFDAVINHISAQSAWFRAFLCDDPTYRDHFIVVPEGVDLSQVVRPRALPLLTRFRTPSGDKLVWTTFSADQVDLNYANPQVLLDIVDTLLFYVAQGAEFIRLDAVAYLWKEIGTPCIHLPQTHRVIQLLRAIFDVVAPHVMLVTETNVPHAENVSYFGDGTNEAQLVYNFALPPLVLHTFRTANAETLSSWAAGLSLPSNRVTFLNFLASHDGIGLNPVRGILSETELEALVQQTLGAGGLVSYKFNADGTQSPYELNINYFDVLAGSHIDESPETQVKRFMAAQAIMLALVGVPGIYFHSLFGSRGWPEGVKLTGHKRTVNRQKCEWASLEAELADITSLRRQVFSCYVELLRARAGSPAFHPHGTQRVLSRGLGRAVFGVWRNAPKGSEQVLCLHNVSNSRQQVEIAPDEHSVACERLDVLTDLLSGHTFQVSSGPLKIELAPYEVLWLKAAA